MADEQKDSQQPEKPAEQPKPAAPAGEGKAAIPKPPPPPPGAKPAAPAASPKPKGPQQEPWSSPLVDAIKEKFGVEFIKSYSFLDPIFLHLDLILTKETIGLYKFDAKLLFDRIH